MQQIVATRTGLTEDGADLGASVSMLFSDGRVASFVTDLRVDLPCSAAIAGTEGTIEV